MSLWKEVLSLRENIEGEWERWGSVRAGVPVSYLGNRWGLELGKRQRREEEEEGRSYSRAPIPPLGFRGWGTGMSLSLKFENRFCEMVTPLGGGESTERKQVFGMHQEGLCLNWELEPWAAQPRRRAGAWAGKPAPSLLATWFRRWILRCAPSLAPWLMLWEQVLLFARHTA